MPVSPWSILSPRRPAALLGALLGALLALALATPIRAEPASEAVPARLCAPHIARAERAHGLPPYLLGAIAKVESGRVEARSGATIAWPWTVTARGRGRFLPTKAAAIAAVERLRAQGVGNIDVGCMQINLRYHPDAFADLEAAFDPAQNVAYAARLLVRLRRAVGSWTRAVGDYHSGTPRLSGPYRVKVFKARFAARKRAATPNPNSIN